MLNFDYSCIIKETISVNDIQRSDASHDIFKGDTEILYIETT